jgi:hypothetical protein
MIEAETLESISTQLMTSTSVSAEGKPIPVRPASRQHLRTAAFTLGGHQYQEIEQNPGEVEPLRASGAEWSSSRPIQGRRKQQVCGGCGGWRGYVLRRWHKAVKLAGIYGTPGSGKT